jgi:hypothetical protein
MCGGSAVPPSKPWRKELNGDRSVTVAKEDPCQLAPAGAKRPQQDGPPSRPGARGANE